MKKILGIVLCLVLAAMMFAACSEEAHQHTFDTQIQYDSEYHWYPATCEHSDLVEGKEAHIDEDGNDICDKCPCVLNHEHKYETQWTFDANKHWHKASCGHQVRQDEANHADANNDGICDTCAYDYDHTHTYANIWSITDGGHWHAPSCGHNVPGIDKTAHLDSNNDGLCDDCGYSDGHEHTFDTAWTTDENDHWMAPTCGHDVPPAELGKHVDGNGDGVCDVCGSTQAHFHSFDESEWVSDATGHWYAATCEHGDQKKSFAAHDGYEATGICASCGYQVFHVYTVTLNGIPSYVQIRDNSGNVLTGPFQIKDGDTLSLFLVVPDYAKLEGLQGATLGEPVLEGTDSVYPVTLTVTADTDVDVIINKLTCFEEIVAKGEGSITCTGFQQGFAEITFEAPSAGTYAIYSLSNGFVRFTPPGKQDYSKYAIFEVQEPGTVTVRVSTYGNGGGEHVIDFTYHVIRIDDAPTLPGLQGSGYILPTVIPVDVYVVLPKAGLYQITSSYSGLAINDDVSKPYFITAPEDNYRMKLTLMYDISDYPILTTEFNLDWTIKLIEAEVEVQEGENPVTVLTNQYLGFSFTAPKTGTYEFALSNEYLRFCQFNAYNRPENIGKLYSVVLKEGQSLTLFVSVNTIDYGSQTPITDALKVTYQGNVPVLDELLGGYVAAVGIPNTFIPEIDGDYVITLPAGASISFDNGATWSAMTEQVMSFEANEAVSYLIRGEEGQSEVVVGIQRKEYRFELNAEDGKTSVTMVPGKEYYVTLTGSIYTGFDGTSYILSWTNERITVIYGSERFTTSPAQIDGYNRRSSLTIIYNGTAEADIDFTLVDNYEIPDVPVGAGDATLVLGNNKVHVTVMNYYCEGTTGHFTAPFSGTFILSAAEGEANADIGIYLGQDVEWITLPYTFTLEEGKTLSFLIATSAYMSVTEDDIDLVLVEKIEEQHVHTYSNKLTSDATGHWYPATCNHTNEKKNFSAHAYNSKGICETCGYEHEHTYAETWSVNDQKHWQAPTCGHTTANRNEAEHSYNAKGICTVCGAEHKHTYASAWSTDDSSHWKEVTCGHQVSVGQLGAHADADKDGKCDTCSKVVAHYHTFDTSKWVSDANNHWHASTCGHADAKDQLAAHSYNAKGICTVCGTEHTHTYEDAYRHNETKHWQESDCNHGVANRNEAEHSYDSKGVCTVCGYEHIHTFSEEWSSNAEGHFYATSCGHEVKLNVIAHSYDSLGVCSVCGYEHEHTYDEVLTSDSNYHYYAPNCGHAVVGKNVAEHTYDSKGICTVCGFEHLHTYSNLVLLDSSYHHKLPTCGHDVPAIDVDSHSDMNNDGICDGCDWAYDHSHSYNESYASNEDGHWREPACGHNLPNIDIGEHIDDVLDGKCDVCGYDVPISHPVLDMLNGSVYHGFLLGNDQAYVLTFTPAGVNAFNGTVDVVDNFSGTYTGKFLYSYTSGSGIMLTKEDGSAALISIALDETAYTMTLTGTGIIMPVPLTLAQGGSSSASQQVGKFELTFHWSGSSTSGDVSGADPTVGAYAANLTFTAPFTGRFTLKLPVGVSGISAKETTVYGQSSHGLPYVFELYAGETVSWSLESTVDIGTVTLTMMGKELDSLSRVKLELGEQIVPTKDAWGGGNKCLFVAPSAGTYVIKLGDNAPEIAYVGTSNGNGVDGANSQIFTLEEGQMVYVYIGNYNYGGIIDVPIVVEKIA